MPGYSGNLDLQRAWRRVKRNSRGDPIPPTIEYAAFRAQLEPNLSNLCGQVRAAFNPRPLKMVDLVKPNFTLRPCSVPEIEDRVYYQALVDRIAVQVDVKLLNQQSGVVFGFQLKGPDSEEMFEEGGYSEFYQRARTELLTADRFMLVTDIASYYETVDHSTLRSILLGLGTDEETVNELIRLLGRWSNNIGRGLPQSLWASDYLGARVYLDRLDKAMLRHGYTYFRYSDDIRIIAPSEIEAKKALRDLVLEARRSQLFLQGAKTKIYTPQDALEELEKFKNRAQQFIQRGLAWTLDMPLYGYSAPPEEGEEEITDEGILSTAPVLRGLIEEELQKREPDAIILRRCINGLRRVRDKDAIPLILEVLRRLPTLTQDATRYLWNVAAYADVKDPLLALLQDESNIYDWREMWLLHHLYSASGKSGDSTPFAEDEIRVIAEIAFDKNRHWACRVAAIRILGKYGDDAYRAQIRDLYNDETHPDVRHSIIEACMRLPTVDRNRFINACLGQDPRTDRLINYLRAKKPADG